MSLIEKTCITCGEKFIKEGRHRRTQWCTSCTKKRQERDKQAHLVTSKRTREAIKDKRLCQICNERPVANTHHIIPVSKGGNDDDENLLELCVRCHYIEHGMENPIGINC